MTTVEVPLSIDEMIEDHRCGQGELITFDGLKPGFDVYNPAPFELNGRVHLLGRVERHDKKISHLAYFGPNGAPTSFVHEPRLPEYELSEDPFLKRINGQIVQGMVRVSLLEDGGVEALYTSIITGEVLDRMAPLINGPPGMKDLRLFPMADGQVGALTRPEHGTPLKKEVGFVAFNSIEDVSSDALRTASIIPGLMVPLAGEHRGGNEGVALDNGLIGYLGHIARISPDMDKEYFVETAEFDPESLESRKHRIIACPDCFSQFEPKTPKHQRVVFPQGILGGKLYVGLGDAASGVLEVGNVFSPAQPLGLD